MSSSLKAGVVPGQGAHSTIYLSSHWDTEALPAAFASSRSSSIVVPGPLQLHRLMNKLRLGENSTTSIQNIIGCIKCSYEKEVKKRYLHSNAYVGTQLRLESPRKRSNSWHVEALKDGASFRTCNSALGHKVANKASSSAEGFSTFDNFWQAFQEFARQNTWIALLQPLQLGTEYHKDKDNRNKEALYITERKVLFKFSTFLSTFFKMGAAPTLGDATASTSAQSFSSDEDIHCQPTKHMTSTSSTTSDQFRASLSPVFEISSSCIVTSDIPLQEILYNPFISYSQPNNSRSSILRRPEVTAVEQSQVYQLKPQAELCASIARCVTAKELGSLEALADWLKERLAANNLPLSFWGKAPGTKSLSNLWCELVEGEIFLEDSCPPKRTVHVASVHIRNESGSTLVEAYQEMSDGRIRQRNKPLSEKMRLGENVEDACLRGIYEELGWQLGARDRVSIFQDSYMKKEEERESNSYPGLWTRYIIHTMSARIKQLPATEFFTIEDESHQLPSYTGARSLSNANGDGSTSTHIPVGVKRHFWKWI
ncbi:hypothetical protein O6H91_15G016600 [Diphasiastrum complanatum]|uniref:Uncharacterized protein n=2 Tax=Diphasiastrum complanatum TaxID=34168 RepID=A0ACC2BG09_DIPCM|nr:hypothetical protein O6H91_15G016600 [Diphasiastrum complanatum]